jgi:hypothetical protein
MTEAELIADLELARAIDWASYTSLALSDPDAPRITDRDRKMHALGFAGGAKWADAMHREVRARERK